ncbi:hypothetical protein DFJ73DRAFT_621847 [Zopfochytrium polystomum]|nr:hypothetical protein DFJ73DRAFT_621847 [Zopfochytrium polystomum]
MAGTLQPREPVQRNSLRERAEGECVLMTPLTVSEDDMSGNESKKWNKYESWNFQFARLPQQLRDLHENIHFIMTSKTASGIESAEAIAACFRELRTGISIFDPIRKKKVTVVACILQTVGDNLMHAVICSKTGLTSSHPCRFCQIPDFQLGTSPDHVAMNLLSYLDPHSSPNYVRNRAGQDKADKELRGVMIVLETIIHLRDGTGPPSPFYTF